MLLVLFNAVVISLVIVTIIQGYEIRMMKKDISHIKFVQVAAVLNEGKHPLKKLVNDIEAKLKEGKEDERESKV